MVRKSAVSSVMTDPLCLCPYICTHLPTQFQLTYFSPQSFHNTHKTEVTHILIKHVFILSYVRISLRQTFLMRFRKTEKICQVALSTRLSAWNNSAHTGRIFIKFDIWVFFRKICWENSSSINIWQE